MMNDCAYYFDRDVLTYDATILFSHWEFFPRTGGYVLPCNEGTVSITQAANGRLDVCMTTRCSGISYTHPLVATKSQFVNRSINFGWFKHVEGQAFIQAGKPLPFSIVVAPIMQPATC